MTKELGWPKNRKKIAEECYVYVSICIPLYQIEDIRCPISLKRWLLSYRVIYTLLALYQNEIPTHKYTIVLTLAILY